MTPSGTGLMPGEGIAAEADTDIPEGAWMFV